MYDELVKRLRICHDYNEGCSNCPHEHDLGCRSSTMREAADAIEELSKQLDDMNEANIALYGALPKWIPVTERLPETPGEYMVAYHPCYWDRVHDEIKVGLDSFRGKTSWAKKKYQRVTHWMPLPEPPKEE